MKWLVNLSFSLILMSCKTDYAELVINYPALDVGHIKIGEPVIGKFRFLNHGNNSIRIDTVLTDCNCLGYKISSKFIEPDEALTLSIYYESKSYGYFKQRATLYGNFSNSPILVTVQGYVNEGI